MCSLRQFPERSKKTMERLQTCQELQSVKACFAIADGFQHRSPVHADLQIRCAMHAGRIQFQAACPF